MKTPRAGRAVEHVIVDFVKDAIKQLMGWDVQRRGRLRMSRHCFLKMQEYELTPQILEDTFRNGFAVADNKILQNYSGYSVGLIWTYEPSEERTILITCWKQRYYKGGER